MAKKLPLLSLSNPTYLPVSFGSAPFSPPADLPQSPGIYIFSDGDGNPLYIGKSINLKSRLSQHFENSQDPDSKPAHFIPKTKTLILQPVESDLAAIILEANLIKTYQPYYNSATKDDKTVSFIVITNPPNYKLNLVHKSDLRLRDYKSPSTQIYGPYPSGKIANIILKQVRQIFGYCQNPRGGKSCFYFHIHQCPGICNGTISQAAYAKHLTRIKIFLGGRFVKLIQSLTKEIGRASKMQNFELAAKLKNQLASLQTALFSHRYSKLLILPSSAHKVLNQIVLSLQHPLLSAPPQRIECFDMATLNQENTVGAMVVFIDGQPAPTEYRKFIVRSKKQGDPHAMKHIIIRRLKHSEWDRPDLIILDGGVPQLSIVSEVIPSDIPVIALSKKRETIHFFDHGHQIVNLNLPLHSSSLKLLQHIRDEAHRFGTTFHKKRRLISSFQ